MARIKSVSSREPYKPGSPAAWIDENWRRFVVAPADLRTWDRGDMTAPQLSGVYFLWAADGGLEYIGHSVDTHYRMNQHAWAERIPFVAYSALPVDCPDTVLEFALPCFEANYIKALMPPHNSRWSPAALSSAKGMDEAIAAAWAASATASALEDR